MVKSASNFKAHVLNNLDIPHQRVYGHPWFLIQMPFNNKRLQEYNSIELASIDVYVPPYTHIILLDDSNKEMVKNVLLRVVTQVSPASHNFAKTLPMWWTNARGWIQKNEVSYRELLRFNGTLNDALKILNVKHNQDYPDRGRWVLLQVPTTTATDPSRTIAINETEVITWCRLQGSVLETKTIGQPTPVVFDKKEFIGILQLQSWSFAENPPIERVVAAMKYIIRVEGMPLCEISEEEATAYLKVIQEVVADGKEDAVRYYLRRLTEARIMGQNTVSESTVPDDRLHQG